jgi:hypothetical protein
MRRVKRGSSLVELVASLALFGIVSGAILRALDRQARFHDGIARVLEAGTQLSASHDAVAIELRGVGGAAGDVLSASDSAIAYRAQVGSAVVCAVGALSVDLAPAVVATGQRLAHFASAPQAGDTAWFFDDGPLADASDDQWVPAPVAGAARAIGACRGTPFVHSALDSARSGWHVTLATISGLPATVVTGSTVRFTRHARFALYRGSTGETYLGWTDWNHAARAWNVIQPLSGPFLAFDRAQPSASGVAFAAWDSAERAVAVGAAGAPVRRIVVTARALSRGEVRMDGVRRGVRVDSLHSQIGLRNWR